MSCMSPAEVNDYFEKDPDAVLDYACDWAPWLIDGDTITGVTWTVPDGLTQDEDKSGHADTKTTIWLSGGTLGQTYEVVTHIVTAQGREEDQTQTFAIVEK